MAAGVHDEYGMLNRTDLLVAWSYSVLEVCAELKVDWC